MSAEITKDLVKHVAKLSMLKIEEAEIGQYQDHLGKILKHIDELAKVNTDGVKPMANPMRENLDLFMDHNDRREDMIGLSLPVQEVLRNAPDQKLNQFKIEAVIDSE